MALGSLCCCICKFLDLSLHTNWFAVLPPLGKTLISVQHNFCQTTGGVDFKHRLVLMTMWILMTMSTISMLLLTFGTWRWRWPSSQPTPGQLASGQSGSRGQQWQSSWHSWGWFIDNHNHNMVTRFLWVLNYSLSLLKPLKLLKRTILICF